MLANDMRLPVETLVRYTLTAIEDHYKQALEEEKNRDKRLLKVDISEVKNQKSGGWNTVDRTNMYDREKAKSVRKMAMNGWSVLGMVKVSGYEANQIRYILSQAPEVERGQRIVALKSKKEVFKSEVLRLWNTGICKAEIARRVNSNYNKIMDILNDKN